VDILHAKTGHSVPADDSTIGEIVLRGACITLGYLNDGEAAGTDAAPKLNRHDEDAKVMARRLLTSADSTGWTGSRPSNHTSEDNIAL
jgi:hypothetical protein